MKNKYYLKFTGKYLLRMVTLLIAVSIISFVLVSLSPVDPVQQYVGAVPNVSVEQRAKIAEYCGLNDPPVGRVKLLWSFCLTNSLCCRFSLGYSCSCPYV